MIDWTTDVERLERQAENAMNCADGLAKSGEPSRGIVYALNGLTSAVLLVAAATRIREASETGVRND